MTPSEWAAIAVRLALSGGLLTVIASLVGLVRIRARDRVQEVALGWASIVLALLLARLAWMRAPGTMLAARAIYTLTLLQVPLALHLIGAPREPKRRMIALTVTTGVGVVALFGTAFTSNVLVQHLDGFGDLQTYSVPGTLGGLMAPYGLFVGIYLAIAGREETGPDAALIRRILVVAAAIVVPCGVNDMLMTIGAVHGILVVDIASSFAVFALALVLSRRAQDAHAGLVQAIADQQAALRRGDAEMRAINRLAELGAEMATMLERLRPPIIRLAGRLMEAEDGVLAHRDGAGDSRWMEARDVLAEARDSATRVSTTLDLFEEFSRGRPARIVVTDLRPLAERALAIVGNELRHRARLVRKLGQTPVVAADPDRLVQAVVTLLLRAMQVVPRVGGRITVEALAGSGTAILRIADNGPAISEELLPHVFDPYVASEAQGEGLGLAMCHRVITGLGGRLGLVSSASGTEFTIELPEQRG
jgi:signal transduction histidine kinase